MLKNRLTLDLMHYICKCKEQRTDKQLCVVKY
jgi:hypothetical protein